MIACRVNQRLADQMRLPCAHGQRHDRRRVCRPVGREGVIDDGDTPHRYRPGGLVEFVLRYRHRSVLRCGRNLAERPARVLNVLAAENHWRSFIRRLPGQKPQVVLEPVNGLPVELTPAEGLTSAKPKLISCPQIRHANLFQSPARIHDAGGQPRLAPAR
jgi:hypothetical protein